jgi:hypothetical protein
MIGSQPPHVPQDMRSSYIWNAVPNDRVMLVFYGKMRGTQNTDIVHVLGIKMNFPTEMEGQSFNLLDNTAFRSMSAVKKWRKHS